MEGLVDPDALLDYAEFELFPNQNRYEVCVCSGKKVETVASGLLEHLLLHSSEVKSLFSKRSNATFRIQLTDTLNGAEWFTKSTLTRFLHVVGSPDVLNLTKDFENEISQLQETRRFQISLDAKGRQNQFGSEEADGRKLDNIAPISKAEVENVSPDVSKNELLRAMDLRLTALHGELASVFNQAAGTSCSLKELINIEIFSHHFGAINIRNSLQKFVELSQKVQIDDLPSDCKFLFTTKNPRSAIVSKTEGGTLTSVLSSSDAPVKYGVSPAKAAQIERQSSTESEESSFSNEEDQPSVERSRTLIRSASPRRSASPMRRIQIGRSGSRRANALTIKSLNYFPGRERVASHTYAAMTNSVEEGTEQPPRKTENNVQRISVQDAISLFESKQRDHKVDIQKTKSLLNASIGANKSVLRRWSAGMGESSAQCPPNIVCEDSIPINPNNSTGGAILMSSQEVKQESEYQLECQSPETIEVNSRSESSEKRQSNPVGVQVDSVSTGQEVSSEKLTASAEWSQQKEADLNQLLMKMMNSKAVKYQNKAINDSHSKNVPNEHRGGFYDNYKQKRDEKLREVAGKRAEKEAQFKAMQLFLDERKAEMASTNASTVSRRHTTSKAPKSIKNLSQLVNPKKETSKPAVLKKASSKATPLPAMRKSWPSTPSPRAAGTIPAKTPGGTISTGTTPTRGKPQPASSAPRMNPKVERPQLRSKTIMASQSDSKRSVKGVNEKLQQTLTKNGKTTKTKVQIASGDYSSTAKPVLCNKVTKKSSVVPLESKPFLRKGSRISSGASSIIKIKPSSQPEESLKHSQDPMQAEENELHSTKSNMVSQQLERDLMGLEIHADLEPENKVFIPKNCEDTESSEPLTASVDDITARMAESIIKTETEEESIISPAAWVEIEEEYEDQPTLCDGESCQKTTTANVAAVGVTSPRVRHSLSQMLLEESSEPDVSEWGNAENPPALVYQKDAPKGLKRLLKFARKSKLDSHLSDWSSPSAFSEGEDEAEESKAGKKNADNLLKKAALNAKNYGLQKTTSCEAHEQNSAQSNAIKFTSQGVRKMQEGHISSASVTTSKATRSFFSLSAFKGIKPNEAKFR